VRSRCPLLRQFDVLHAIMFEPSPDVAGRLLRNLSLNGELWGRAKVLNMALSDASGIKEFFVSNETWNSGVAGLRKAKNRAGFSVTVQAYTADSLVSTAVCPVPNLVKIDVEGFELEVLQGMESILKNHRPTVVFEHSPYRFEERQISRDSVIDYLKSLHYVITRVEHDKPVEESDLGVEQDFCACAPAAFHGSEQTEI